jgi:hypothetical protein
LRRTKAEVIRDVELREICGTGREGGNRRGLGKMA